jgi:putative transposase
MCVGKGDDDGRAMLAACGFPAPLGSRGAEAQALREEAGDKARRWDKKARNYRGFLHFACGLIAFRAAGLFG